MEVEAGLYFNEIPLAKRWGVSHKTLQRWRVLRLGPEYLKIGGCVRYRLIEVESFEETVLTKCAGGQPNGKPRIQEDQAPQVTSQYPTLKDAIEAPASDEVAR